MHVRDLMKGVGSVKRYGKEWSESLGGKRYDALDCPMILRGSAGARLVRYSKLCFLPDKAALF